MYVCLKLFKLSRKGQPNVKTKINTKLKRSLFFHARLAVSQRHKRAWDYVISKRREQHIVRAWRYDHHSILFFNKTNRNRKNLGLFVSFGFDLNTYRSHHFFLLAVAIGRSLGLFYQIISSNSMNWPTAKLARRNDGSYNFKIGPGTDRDLSGVAQVLIRRDTPPPPSGWPAGCLIEVMTALTFDTTTRTHISISLQQNERCVSLHITGCC